MGGSIIKKRMCLRLLIFLCCTISLSSFAQRRLKCRVMVKQSESYVIVKYKGVKGDYLWWSSSLFYIPSGDIEIELDSVNQFSPSMSFIHDTDTLAYQLKSEEDIDSIDYEMLLNLFQPEFNDYSRRNGIKHRRAKFKILLSIDPKIIVSRPQKVQLSIIITKFWLLDPPDPLPIYLETIGKVKYRE
jgi:hypothetical protein